MMPRWWRRRAASACGCSTADATRLDLLRVAGAATAKILVVAVDDKAQSLKIIDLAKEHFPNLQIVARAKDVTHWNELRDRA